LNSSEEELSGDNYSDSVAVLGNQLGKLRNGQEQVFRKEVE
jgi:hypothetical protein